jgi:hypothetical protein
MEVRTLSSGEATHLIVAKLPYKFPLPVLLGFNLEYGPLGMGYRVFNSYLPRLHEGVARW